MCEKCNKYKNTRVTNVNTGVLKTKYNNLVNSNYKAFATCSRLSAKVIIAFASSSASASVIES